MKRTWKTLLSLIMAAVLAITLLPLAALAVTDIPIIRLSTPKPIVGDSDFSTLPVDAYGYGIYDSLWYTIGLAKVETKWQYTDEFGDHLMAAGDPYQPETVYTAIVTLTARYDWKFADPPEIYFNDEPALITAWDSSNPETVTVSCTFPATDPLYEVNEARMDFDEPLYGANPDFTPDVDYGASFSVIDVQWMDSHGNLLSSTDVFTTGDYTLYVTIKPISTCKFAAPDAMSGSFAEIAWHEYVETDVALAADPNNRILSYTWTVPEPITAVELTIPQQGYGEVPILSASPDYWDQSQGYYVKEVKWTDDSWTALASDEVFTNAKSYYAWLDVYPARGNTFSSSLTATINGAAATVIDKTDYVTVYAPVTVKAPADIDTVEIKMEPGVEIGNEINWGSVASDADYFFDNVTWYDKDDNELYDFHYESGATYKAKIEIDAGMGFAFVASADMKVLIDGEYADEVIVAADSRSLTAWKTYIMNPPWAPLVKPESVFDFSVSDSYGAMKGGFDQDKATLAALVFTGAIDSVTAGDVVKYDLNKDGVMDISVAPGTDPAYENFNLLEGCSATGDLSFSVDTAALDYLKEKKPAGYVDTIKFVFPAAVEKYTVSFDANGGTGTMAPKTVVKGEKLKLPACTFTAPADKVFDLWNVGAPGDEILVTADMTVKALWKDKASDSKVNPFKDVFETDYYYDAVLWAYYAEPQVTNGMSSDEFWPTSTVTRGQAVTFLWRAMGKPEPTTAENPFEDVAETDYFYKPVLWAVENGITNGTDATHFTPSQTCSTAHIITFLYRTLGIGENGWYEVAGAWAKGAKLLDGLTLEVAPGVDCPRADVVLFLYRAVK